jgi:hypothetical protein
MNFAGFPKFSLLLPLACILAIALAGCGSSNNMALTQGNWSVAATSTAVARRHNIVSRDTPIPNNSNVSFYVGGNLTQTGSNLAGTMYITGSCVDPSAAVPFTGTVKGTKVTLTSASIEGNVITVSASGTTTSATSSLTGTYTVTGEGCDGGDSGTVTATAVPSISGTWSGSLVNNTSGTNGIAGATISIALTQASTVSDDGTFALSGSVTYTNSTCSLSGTLTGGFVSGQFVKIDASTIDQGDGTGSFEYGLALLDSPSAPANMTSGYSVFSDGPCGGDVQTLTLTKQ